MTVNLDKPQRISVIWFRDDLRLHDHQALTAAAAHGPVVALVVDEDSQAVQSRSLGAASRWWRERSLRALRKDLADHGVELLRFTGDPRQIVPRFARAVGASLVTWTRRYYQPLTEVDAQIKSALQDLEIDAHSFPGFTLTEPWEVQKKDGGDYRVYTPYAKAARGVVSTDAPLPVPALRAPGVDAGSAAADDGLECVQWLDEPHHPSWADGLKDIWTPGEAGARERLADFLDAGAGYGSRRDVPSVPATSRLSAHLRFGEVSPREVYQAAAELPDDDAETFRKELLWRDFAWHRLYYRPEMPTQNLNPLFDRFDWSWSEGELDRASANGRDPRRPVLDTDSAEVPEEDREWLQLLGHWRSGTTQVPMVDAGMRELWHTGTMHNRVRMLVASFLTKNLGIHWRHGEQWFWDTLVDADLASNPFNWQWAAGSGDDAAPYFRIFNPETQRTKFDPEGAYVGRWVPEFLTPGYSEPIVDLKESRRAALDTYADAKAEGEDEGGS
ncbi:cryptochrome/photolyase family protein [Corynebacterium urogenitale]